MNVQAVKEPKPRIEYPSIDNLGIIAYGYNNLYPQEISSIIACSESGATCLNRYIQFIQGNGFKEERFSEMVVNSQGDTADDVLQSISDDLGRWGGYAIHVNYNLLADIVEISHVPFENCRLSEEDDSGYTPKIGVFPDWSGKKKRNGKQLRPTKETIDYIDRFNPIKEVVLSQIEKAGTIENYKGQVLWFSSAGKQEYPKAIYDSVVTQLSTEEALGNIAYRNSRCNLLPGGMLITKKGQDTPDDDDDEKTPIRRNDNSDINTEVSKLQSDLQTGKIIHFEIEFNEEKPEFVNFQGANYDKDFTVTSDTVCEKIYASFGQEVWHRLRKGSVGFSSDIMKDAYDVYSSTTGTERRMIERAFDKIFKHWYQEVPTSDFTVQPLKYISSETALVDSGGGDPLAVKLGVGGTQAMMEVVNGYMSDQKKANALRILFGLSDAQINELVYGKTSDNK